MEHMFEHIGITVRYLDISVNFYCKYLGLSLIRQSEITSDVISRFFEIYHIEKPVSCKTALLEMAGGGRLELFEFSPSFPSDHIVWNRVGLTHLAFLTDSAAAKHAELSLSGVDLCDVLATRPDGGKRFFIRDPDGILIEIMESFPKK